MCTYYRAGVRFEEQLNTHDKYNTNLKQIGILSREFCKRNLFVADELRQALKSVESSPAKRLTLLDLFIIINEVENQVYRVRQIFAYLTNTTMDDLPPY